LRFKKLRHKRNYKNFRSFNPQTREVNLYTWRLQSSPLTYITINHIAGLISRSHRSRTRPIFQSRSVSPRPSIISIREKSLSIEYLSFSTELGILGEWCARPRCPARIGRFTCHLRRNERERTIATGEKGKDERASSRVDIPIDRNRSTNACNIIVNTHACQSEIL